MKGKNVIVTGATSGIGFETAKALAQKGATVYLVGRSKQKAEEAVNAIKQAAGHNAVHYFLANLSSQKSVRELAVQIKKQVSCVDVLVNNAGAVFGGFELSEDGYEMTIATNHFAYYLLTMLLLDLIKKSDEGRIVNVSSDSHYRGKINFDSFTQNKGFFTMTAYGQSKLANVFFTQELAEKLKGTSVTVNCLHPGVVKTNIGNKDTPWYTSAAWSFFAGLRGVSVQEGAKTSIYLASSPEVKGITGKYFDKCRQKAPAKLASNTALQKQLWDLTEQCCPLE